jgi:hypothetical protein
MLTLRAVKVADVLDAIMAPNKRYTWAYQDGLVMVRRLDTPPGVKNLLKEVLPEFSIQRSTLQEASLLLYMSLSHRLHPGPWGILGDYNPGLTNNLVGPLTMRDATVKQVLNRLVSEKKSAAWLVQVPPQFMDQLPSSGLWSIVEYDDPALKYAGENLRQNLLPYSRPDKDAANKHH